jgi:hypothetical protein
MSATLAIDSTSKEALPFLQNYFGFKTFPEQPLLSQLKKIVQ